MVRVACIAILGVVTLTTMACSREASEPAKATMNAPSATPPAVVVPSTPTPPVTESATATGTAKDSPATDPKATLSKEDESKAMPMAAHGNNHSSPSLEAPKTK